MQGYQQAVHHLNHELGLAAKRKTAPPPTKYSAEQSAAEEQAALTTLAADQRDFLLADRYQAGLDSVHAEFSTYLRYAAPPGHNSWDTCTDLQVLTFAKMHWLRHHQGKIRDEVAPATLDTMLAQLSRGFIARDRAGPWCGIPHGIPVGNPVDSQRIRDFKRTFRKRATAEGYCEVSAVPLPEAAFQGLLDGIDREIAALLRMQSGTGQAHYYEWLILERDAAAFTVLWHCYHRGQDILRLVWSQVYSQLLPKQLACTLWQISTAAQPAVLYARPLVTKTEQTTTPETWQFKRLPSDQSRYCAVHRLQRLYCLTRLAGLHVDDGHVFTGFCARNSGVMQPGALQDRLQAAAQRLPVHLQPTDRNFTLHSFRRGHCQKAHADGVPYATIKLLAGMKDDATLRKYLDVGRHLR
jgi:hypothetical protein